MPKSKVTNLQEAYLSSKAPNFIDPDKYQTPAMVRGLKYEAQVKEQLKELFTEDTKVFSGPWIKYFDGSFFPFVVTLTDEYIKANWNNLKEKFRR